MGLLPESYAPGSAGHLAHSAQIGKKLNKLHYDVRADYGCVGDGSTDDTTNAQAAVTAAGNAGGGIVFFPLGTYILSQLSVPTNVSILGAGRGATALKLKPSTSNNLLVNSDSSGGNSHIVVANLTLDGNKANQSAASHVVALTKVSYCEVLHCEIRNAKMVSSVGGDGVYFGGVSTHNLLAFNVLTGLDRNGVSDVSGSYIRVLYNTISSPGLIGIDIEPNVDAATSAYNKIVGNTITSSGNRGILVEGANSSPSGAVSVEHNLVADNTVLDAGHTGIEVSATANGTRVAGNTVLRSQRYGISTSSYWTRIQDNTVEDNSRSGAGTYPGIYLNASRCVVTGNTSVDLQGTKTQSYGIQENAGADRNVIVGNMTYQNLTGSISTVGANTVKSGNVE